MNFILNLVALAILTLTIFPPSFLSVAPAKPTCTGPELVENGAVAQVTCSSDRVYPTAECEANIFRDPGNVRVKTPLSVSRQITASEQYPGDKKLTCWFKLHLANIDEGRYKFEPQFYVDLPSHKANITKADALPDLNLRATTLENPYDAHDKIAVAPKPKELTRNISVISNPPPNLFSLAVRQNESSTPVHLSSKFYSVHYRSEGDGSLKGTIELNVSTSAVTVEERFNHFLLSASNGLVGRNVFLYKLTWIRLDILPTQPTCNAPVFIDQGATVLFTCSADRVYSSGRCSFQPTADSLRENLQGSVRTKNEDSKAYPGQKVVTCELYLSVARNKVGVYQFQVEITPSFRIGDQSVIATTPSVNLANAPPQGKKGWSVSINLFLIIGGIALVLGLIAAPTVFLLRRKRNAQSFNSKNNASRQKGSL
ncbi:hypothetical protein RRG08_001837, partial [Elysia crispata]